MLHIKDKRTSIQRCKGGLTFNGFSEFTQKVEIFYNTNVCLAAWYGVLMLHGVADWTRLHPRQALIYNLIYSVC